MNWGAGSPRREPQVSQHVLLREAGRSHFTERGFPQSLDHVRQGGAPPTLEGWYSELFFDTNSAGDYDPTIADVHTQPTDEGGAPEGRVLHVGTGNAELMVVTVDTCAGPKAYAGLASSYYEHVTSDFDRLNDERWKDSLSGSPPRPVWMQGVLSP